MFRAGVGSFAVTLVLVMSLLNASPAAAAWLITNGQATAGLQMASMGHEFVPVQSGVLLGTASGAGGDAYLSEWTGLGVGTYFNLRSTATVPVELKGVVTTERGAGLTLFPQITVRTCSVPWNTALGTCPGTVSVLQSAASGATTVSFTWVRAEVGTTAYIAITTGVAAGSIRIGATAIAIPVRAGLDRTKG